MIILDAGALIALEANERGMWIRFDEAVRAGWSIVVPVGVLAQVWREGQQAHLSRALKRTDLISFDVVAKDAGVLCGKAGTGDVVDASVALAAIHPAVRVLYTSDPDDLARLLKALGRKRNQPKIVPC